MAIGYFGKDGFDSADISFQGLGELVITNALGALAGCLDNSMFNYNSNYNADCDGNFPGSNAFNAADPNFGVTTCCVAFVYGCTDPAADNFDPAANTSNSSCIYYGCTDPNFVEFDPNANVDDGTCATPITYGCMDTSTGTIGDGSGYAYDTYINGGPFTNPCDGTNGDPCVADPYGTMQTIVTNAMGCCCEHTIVGCMDPTATNFDINANTAPASGSTFECIIPVSGCTHNIPAVTNYNPNATVEDGSCIYEGCIDPTAVNYSYFVNPADGNTYYATVDDGSCTYAPPGCTHPDADNYDPVVTTDDGSCTFTGCNYDASALTNLTLDNYSPLMGTTFVANGWTYYFSPQNPAAQANISVYIDDSCTFTGCSDPTATNFDTSIQQYLTAFGLTTSIITDDGSCLYAILGCTDPLACNYNPAAVQDDGSCLIGWGCTDANACNYQPSMGCDDGSCVMPDPLTGLCPTPGCTDPTACNYDQTAGWDDGSCTGLLGCINPIASNYNPAATCDDGSCITLVVNGCTDPNSCTYNSAATPGNPTATSACSGYYGCTDATACNYDPNAGCADSSCIYGNLGCTDPNAANYDPTAVCDDGSCSYPLPNCTDSSGVTYTVGDTYGGGLIFYVGAPDCGGPGIHECGAGGFTASGDCAILIGAPGGIANIEWGCYGTSLNLYDPINEAIGAGYINDINIAANCTDTGWDCAADKIDQDNVALPWGYGDWYLPSINELVKAYNNIGPGNVYNLGAGWNNPWNVNLGWKLWSSTESSVFGGQYEARTVDMSNGNIVALDKNASTGDYRAIRREGTAGCMDCGYIWEAQTGNYCDGMSSSVFPGSANYDPNVVWDEYNACLPAVTLGDWHEGGYIYHLNNGINMAGGGHSLSIQSTTTGYAWGCDGTLLSGANGTQVGDGIQNTADIVSLCTATGNAATAVNNNTQGYSDWFLASQGDAMQLLNLISCTTSGNTGNTCGVPGMLTDGTYWTSTQYDADNAYSITLSNTSSPGGMTVSINTEPKSTQNGYFMVRAW
jgi:hypothetical protein